MSMIPSTKYSSLRAKVECCRCTMLVTCAQQCTSHILDLVDDVCIRFCYSGGFALNAAAGGASSVVAVDSSQPALEDAKNNAVRNDLEGKMTFIKDDALKYMTVKFAFFHFILTKRVQLCGAHVEIMLKHA